MVMRTVLCDSARQRCHSRWANVTGCEKGRSLSRSVDVSGVAVLCGEWLTFNGVLVVWPDIDGGGNLAKGQQSCVELHDCVTE